nr:protein HESO1-like isoform X3 [Ipomoea batatas]
MDLFAAKSDLDLSVNFSNVNIPRDRKISTLKKLAKKLNLLQRSGHVHGVNPITRAIVPVLKVVDSGTGVECDISVGNKDGILKSKILYFVSLIDERFRKLCFLMKAWAQAHNINSARDKTLNSLSIILLVAFHLQLLFSWVTKTLQTRNHPILPPFSAILRDGCDTGAVAKSIHKFVNYGQNNTESVAELFLTLLLMVLLYIPSVFKLT